MSYMLWDWGNKIEEYMLNETAVTNTFVPIINDSIATILVPIISASIAAGGLIYTGLSYRDNTKAKYLQVLRDFDNEISEIESSQERNTYYERFIAKYLNVHERLAFLTINKKIPNDLARYYDSSFAATLGILDIPEYAKYKENVTNIIKWCEEQGIQKSEAPPSYSESKK